MTIQIRPMQAADLNCILTIQEKCYPQLEPESKQAFEKKMHLSPITCFVATHNSDIVGYLIALPRELIALPSLGAMEITKTNKPDCLHLHDLAVDPKLKGMGVGSVLVRAFFSSMQKLQLHCASLIAVQGAVSYWNKYGFTSFEPQGESKQALLSYGPHARLMVQQQLYAEVLT